MSIGSISPVRYKMRVRGKLDLYLYFMPMCFFWPYYIYCSPDGQFEDCMAQIDEAFLRDNFDYSYSDTDDLIWSTEGAMDTYQVPNAMCILSHDKVE